MVKGEPVNAPAKASAKNQSKGSAPAKASAKSQSKGSAPTVERK